MKRFSPTDWRVIEVAIPAEKDDWETPFSDSLASGGDQTTSAVGLMWQLAFLGWPDAKLRLKDGQGKPRIVLSDNVDGHKIWILKAKPSCWRLYFYVYEKSQKIFFLHAVCKKKDKQSPSDGAKARKRLNGVGTKGYSAAEFKFPD